MKKHFFTVLTAAAFFLGSGSTAHAITLGLKFQVSTGLDESTQNFIATLPKLFHDEFIATLTDALPIIERGEDYTFNKLDESIDKLSDDAQCAELTLPLVIRASSKIGSHGETYITDVEEFTKTELGKINDHTRPDTALNLYANILDTIQSTRCHTRRSGITVNAALNQQYAIADTGARPWLYLIGLDCDKPAKCYTVAYAQLKKTVETADPRDRATANADERLRKLPVPDIRYGNGYIVADRGPSDRKFHRDDFETKIRDIMDIQFDLTLQNLKRTAAAEKILQDYEVGLQVNESKFQSVKNAWDHGPSTALRENFKVPDGTAPVLVKWLQSVDVKTATDISDVPYIRDMAAPINAKRNEQLAYLQMITEQYDGRLAQVLQDEADVAAKAAKQPHPSSNSEHPIHNDR